MLARLAAITTALLVSTAVPIAAQSTTLLSVSPIPDGAEGRYCYYNGLAFSSQALLTVDVPFRREGPAATQKRLLRCTLSDDGQMFWQEFDLERSGLNQQ